jgi:hypothetical protein
MKGMQLQLFDDLPLPPRPSYLDKEVTDAVVERIFPEIMGWMYEPKHFSSQSEIASIKAELFSAIQYDDDSYDIARNLEREGWDCGRELVDVLDSVPQYRHEVHKRIIQQNWVLKYGVVPKFSVGDAVVFTLKGKQETGEITRIHPETAQYTIYCAQHGHVRKGVGVHGHIIDFEACTTA